MNTCYQVALQSHNRGWHNHANRHVIIVGLDRCCYIDSWGNRYDARTGVHLDDEMADRIAPRELALLHLALPYTTAITSPARECTRKGNRASLSSSGAGSHPPGPTNPLEGNLG